MLNNIYKLIRLKWVYPLQPTLLQPSKLVIYRSTSQFSPQELTEDKIIYQQPYDPSFKEYADTYNLEYGLTYYYRITLIGDLDPSITATSDLFEVSIPNPRLEISCEGSLPNASIYVDGLWDVMIDDVLVGTNLQSEDIYALLNE